MRAAVDLVAGRVILEASGGVTLETVRDVAETAGLRPGRLFRSSELTKLDAAGFHGPYSLALAPAQYNLLLRRYPQGDGSEPISLTTCQAAGAQSTSGLIGLIMSIGSVRQSTPGTSM